MSAGMSETDDTDVLLLIPPDFFLVRSSDSSGADTCTARTVVTRAPAARELAELHASLGALRHRVASLEHSQLSGPFSGASSELRSYTFPRRRRRKAFSRRSRNRLDTSLTSTRTSSFIEDNFPDNFSKSECKLSESLPTKIHYADRQFVDSFAMDSEVSSVVSSSSKRTDKLFLSEIDEFLTKVECYEGPASNSIPHSNIIQETAESIVHNMEHNVSNRITLPSGRMVPQEFLDKYIYLVKNSQGNDPSTPRQPQRAPRYENTAISGNTSKDVEPTQSELKSSVRKLNFSERDVQTTSTPNQKRLTRLQSAPDANSFNPPCNKMYEKASKVLEQYKVSTLSNCDTLSNISSYPTPQKSDYKYRRRDAERSQKSTEAFRKNAESKYTNSVDTDLLSLSELWCEQDAMKNDNAKLEEERLKREHCEAVIQGLQKKVLEQQERLAVAVRVDRAKDSALARLREAWTRVVGGAEAAEGRYKAALLNVNAEMEKLKNSAEESLKKTQHFENEMYKALDLAHDYQEKCKTAQREKQEMEERIKEISEENKESSLKKEREIESHRDNYESVLRLNKQLTECIKNTEDSLEKEKVSHAETKSKLSSAHKLTQGFQEELTLVQQERELLKDKLKEERSRNVILEKQVGEAQSRLAEVQKKESTLDSEVKSLRKHLELQKNELKSYYQKQLEEAVLGKLQEFQLQLDAAEREVERGARARESQLADGHAKRVQRLEEQHKLEVGVLEEKQREEVKLYRLQLVQAGERIAALENKVETYKRRRGQIASQLHDVMESQWRQALDILTSADASAQQRDNGSQQRSASELSQGAHAFGNASAASDLLSLPNLSEDRKYNTDGLSDTEIQQYVKMLLSRPAAVKADGAGDGCDEPTSDRAAEGEGTERPRARRAPSTGKPPWKA